MILSSSSTVWRRKTSTAHRASFIREKFCWCMVLRFFTKIECKWWKWLKKAENVKIAILRRGIFAVGFQSRVKNLAKLLNNRQGLKDSSFRLYWYWCIGSVSRCWRSPISTEMQLKQFLIRNSLKWVIIVSLLSLAGANPDAKRLYDDLLSNYNRLIRPVSNNTDTVLVKLGLRLSQLIDLVSVNVTNFDYCQQDLFYSNSTSKSLSTFSKNNNREVAGVTKNNDKRDPMLFPFHYDVDIATID